MSVMNCHRCGKRGRVLRLWSAKRSRVRHAIVVCDNVQCAVPCPEIEREAELPALPEPRRYRAKWQVRTVW